jgi:ATP-dependent exoDNAse (exonuclease V) beta subunit
VTAGVPEQLALVSDEAVPPRSSGILLTPAQLAATASRGRDVFTEAGAGSGKTGVLVGRYCDCVTEDGVRPDAILAFTFTERAAGELRQRVRRTLMERAHAAAGNGDLERAREIARAAREGERAWITTMHGFCRRVLAAHPLAARMDPRFRVLDEAECARLRERAFDAALEEVVGRGGAAAARFAAAFAGPRLREMVVDAHERLRSQGVDPPRLPDPGPPVRSVKGKDETPELTPAESRRAAEGLAAFTALLDAYDDAYARLKSERSGADFADLELRALSLLRSPGPVADSWRQRFAHVMVDEFQDTNRVQLALIDALRGPETRLFVVGDEFQSIYRFRHADLEVFRERRAAAVADPDIDEIPLRGNFRSRPDVLAAVDFMGTAMFGASFAPLEAGLEPSGDPPGGAPATELLVTDTADDRGQGGWRAEDIELDPPPGENGPACVAEARFLAQRLAELREQGVERGDMVVLLRAFTHVDAFEDALERADLAPYVVGGRGYWSQQQVEDAVRLLGVVANPLDDELLFGALASPACGVSADALWLLRQSARDPEGRLLHVWPTILDGEWPDAIPDEDARRLRRFRQVLAELRAEAPLRRLDSLLDRVISAFDYDLAILAMKGGPRRMANLRKLMRLAAEYEEHDGRDLRGFLDFAEERTRRDEREGMAAVQVEGHDGVRVMTVHAAKGLEFPVVAVADMGRALGAGFANPNLLVGRLPGPVGDPAGARFGMRVPVAAADSLRLWELVELSETESAAEVEEALRLVYVAATRAKQRLILSGTCALPADEAPESLRRTHTALQVVLPALRARGWAGEDGEVELPPAPAVDGGPVSGPAPRIRVAVQRPGVERAARLRARARQSEPPEPVPPKPAAPLLPSAPAPSGAGHLSYSALASYAGCGYRFYVERILGLSSPPETAGDGGEPDERKDDEADELLDPRLGPRQRSLAIGNCVHTILEAGARRSWDPLPAEDVERILAREDLAGDPEARDRVGRLVDGWLASELRAELASDGARLRPEVPFVLDLGGAIVRGKIDLLADTPGGPLVVDYKTDALGDADPAELAGRYETQRDLYALAVHRAAGTGSAGVRAAYCFLEAPERTVLESYDEAGLRAARERLESLIERIREGDFARTDSPHRSLCHGCPAAARLCGNPAWRPQWASAS